jgi:putative membrane protein
MSEHLWTEWGTESGAWIATALLAAAYGHGLWVLWRRAGMGHGVTAKRASLFAAGLLALTLALVSPLAHLADELLSAHMVQHLLLVMIAAPLLVLGQPLAVLAWALPRRGRLSVARAWHRARPLRMAWAWVSLPAVAWAVHLVTFYAWHLPSLYQAAVADEALHALEHGLFLGTAVLFWHALLQLSGRKRLGNGAALLYLFAAALAETPLGALMLFSQVPWYPAYAATAPAFGLSVLEDQQLAGTIMWVPPGLLMLGIAAVMFLAWFEALERHMREREEDSAYVPER